MPISSTPASFHLGSTYESYGQDCTFPIPAGTYTGGQWDVTGNYQGALSGSDSVNVGGNTASFSAHTATGNYSKSTLVTSQQLTLINAAAGGTLSVTYNSTLSATDNYIQTFYLTLTQPAGPSVTLTIGPAVVNSVIRSPLQARTPIKINLSAAAARTEEPGSSSFTLTNGGKRIIPLPAARTEGRTVVVTGGGYDYPPPPPGDYTLPPSGSISVGSGSLRFSQCLSADGSDWSQEIVAASGVEYGMGGVCCVGGAAYAAVYCKNGRVYAKRTYNPLDWTTGVTEIDTGYRGKIYGAAANNRGVICALWEDRCIISRDGGDSWTTGGYVSPYQQKSIVALKHLFLCFLIVFGVVQRKISEDGGMTWQ